MIAAWRLRVLGEAENLCLDQDRRSNTGKGGNYAYDSFRL